MQLDDYQLAQHLPDALERGAYQVYKALIASDVTLSHSYNHLTKNLSEEFVDKGKVFTHVRQGKKSVLNYYGEFMLALNKN